MLPGVLKAQGIRAATNTQDQHQMLVPSTRTEDQYPVPLPAPALSTSPSIKVLMSNTIPSTRSLYQHQCMRHCCARFWSSETSLGFGPFMHRLSQFLIPDKGEGMN